MTYRIIDGGQMLWRGEADSPDEARLLAFQENLGDEAALALIERAHVEKELSEKDLRQLRDTASRGQNWPTSDRDGLDG